MNGFIAEIYSQPDVILETLQAVQTQLHDLKPLLTQIAEGRSVSYTHLTLPTNREV